jgi:hypothetical protein
MHPRNVLLWSVIEHKRRPREVAAPTTSALAAVRRRTLADIRPTGLGLPLGLTVLSSNLILVPGLAFRGMVCHNACVKQLE